MSLVVTLENLRGLGAVGDRVARVIFRGKLYWAWTWNYTNCVIFLTILFLISGVSKVSKVFEQNEDVSVIGEVKAIDDSECIHKLLL